MGTLGGDARASVKRWTTDAAGKGNGHGNGNRSSSSRAPSLSRSRLQESERLELFRDLVDGALGVLGLLCARADELAGAEEQHDDLRIGHAVDEAGELLGLVLDLLESKADGDIGRAHV